MSTVLSGLSHDKVAAGKWMSEQIEAMPEPRPANWPCWTINCADLYRDYARWVSTTQYRLCTKTEFWEVMKLLFPLCNVATVGKDLEKVFDKVRRTYPPTAEDMAREEKAKQLKLRWHAKWEEK